MSVDAVKIMIGHVWQYIIHISVLGCHSLLIVSWCNAATYVGVSVF